MQIKSTNSVSRLVRQICYVPCLHNRFLTADLKDTLNAAIARAEVGHKGEIVLIVENHLPIVRAYYEDCQARAVELFGTYRVWDTADNTGVLIYINLCEHNLQIIADRGIDKACGGAVWQDLYQKTADHFAKKDFKNGVINLIDDIGKLMRAYYPEEDVHGNELPDKMVYLK